MSNIKTLGGFIFPNLFLQSDALSKFLKSYSEEKTPERLFASLSNKDLYSRLLTTINFDLLPQAKKDEYLFKLPGSYKGVSDEEMYDKEVACFIEEAHYRACEDLNVKPAKIRFIPFEKINLDENIGAVYAMSINTILFNTQKDYVNTRPTLLVEVINSVTKQYSAYCNMIDAFKNPDKLTDEEFFIALTTAARVYTMEQMQKDNSSELSIFEASENFSPMNLNHIIYSLSKTRSDFQSAGLYGGEIQSGLRQQEIVFHDNLSRFYVQESILSLEDLVEHFKHTELQDMTNGLTGEVFEGLVNTHFGSFYNSMGADIAHGEKVVDYINRLENESFGEDDYGEVATQEEMDEYIKYMQEERQNAIDNGQNPDEQLKQYYREMESVLPDEGKTYNVPKLPFSEVEDNAQEQ